MTRGSMYFCISHFRSKNVTRGRILFKKKKKKLGLKKQCKMRSHFVNIFSLLFSPRFSLIAAFYPNQPR